jgi:hypothetical protein
MTALTKDPVDRIAATNSSSLRGRGYSNIASLLSSGLGYRELIADCNRGRHRLPTATNGDSDTGAIRFRPYSNRRQLRHRFVHVLTPVLFLISSGSTSTFASRHRCGPCLILCFHSSFSHPSLPCSHHFGTGVVLVRRRAGTGRSITCREGVIPIPAPVLVIGVSTGAVLGVDGVLYDYPEVAPM